MVNLPEFFVVAAVHEENGIRLEKEALEKTRKRKLNNSSSSEVENDDGDEDDEYYEELKKDVKKKRSNKHNDKPRDSRNNC